MNKKDILALENRYMDVLDDNNTPQQETNTANEINTNSKNVSNLLHLASEDEEGDNDNVITKEVEVALDKVIKNDLLPNMVAVMHVAGIDTKNRTHLNQVLDYIKQQLSC